MVDVDSFADKSFFVFQLQVETICINVLNRLKQVKDVINDIPNEIRNEDVSKIHLELIIIKSGDDIYSTNLHMGN